MNRYKETLIAIAAMAAGALLSFCLPALDRGIFRAVNGFHYQWLDMIMLPITYCGNAVVLLIAVFGVWRMRGRRRFFQALAALLLAGVLVQVLKRVFLVPRPAAIFSDINILGPFLKLYSFPSGHTAAIFSLAVLVRKEFGKIMPLFWVIALMVAVSRVYVGVHFPSDVLFGAGMGYIAGKLVSLIFEKRKGEV